MANDTPLKVRSDARLHELIRLARLAAGLSRPELADRVGLSPRTYERIEDGSRTPLADELLAIARSTGQESDFFESASFDNAAEDGAGTVTPSAAEIKAATPAQQEHGRALRRRVAGGARK